MSLEHEQILQESGCLVPSGLCEARKVFGKMYSNHLISHGNLFTCWYDLIIVPKSNS